MSERVRESQRESERVRERVRERESESVRECQRVSERERVERERESVTISGSNNNFYIFLVNLPACEPIVYVSYPNTRTETHSAIINHT